MNNKAYKLNPLWYRYIYTKSLNHTIIQNTTIQFVKIMKQDYFSLLTAASVSAFHVLKQSLTSFGLYWNLEVLKSCFKKQQKTTNLNDTTFAVSKCNNFLSPKIIIYNIFHESLDNESSFPLNIQCHFRTVKSIILYYN